MTELVNHPAHYSTSRFSCECIAIVRHMTFDAGNAFKYIWRHEDKGTPAQDLSKAVWYLIDSLAFDTDVAGPWISHRHEKLGKELILEHVEPKLKELPGVYEALTCIGSANLRAARRIVERQIAGYGNV